MPVPALGETMRQLVASMEPVYADEPEKLEELKKEARNFEVRVITRLSKTSNRINNSIKSNVNYRNYIVIVLVR